jgi:hypothetical protein
MAFAAATRDSGRRFARVGENLSNRKKPKPASEKAPYQPNEREKAALVRYAAGEASSSAAPRMKKVTNGSTAPKVAPDHPDYELGYRLLMEALGTVSADFLNGLLQQLANAGSQGRELDESGLNFMLSVVKGIKPKDQLEAMLAAQMAAVHMAAMTFARRLAKVEIIEQQDSAERAFNKLVRSYSMQMEALKRYRTGGEQKVTVQHVSVSEGGQAIVGNVTQGANAPTQQPALTDARQAGMPIIDSEQAPVPLRRPVRRKKQEK